MDKAVKFVLMGTIVYYAGALSDSLIGGAGARGVAARVGGAAAGAWLADTLL